MVIYLSSIKPMHKNKILMKNWSDLPSQKKITTNLFNKQVSKIIPLNSQETFKDYLVKLL